MQRAWFCCQSFWIYWFHQNLTFLPILSPHFGRNHRRSMLLLCSILRMPSIKTSTKPCEITIGQGSRSALGFGKSAWLRGKGKWMEEGGHPVFNVMWRKVSSQFFSFNPNLVRCMILYDMILYDMISYDMKWYVMIWYDMIWYVCFGLYRHDFGELWICWWWYALSMFTFIQVVLLQGSFVHEIWVQPCALEKRIQPQLPYENILTCLWCIPVVLLMQLRQITVTITVSPIVFCPSPLEYMYHESFTWFTSKNSTLRKTALGHQPNNNNQHPRAGYFMFWSTIFWVLGGDFEYVFIFTFTWGNDPIWLIFFNWVETTT